MRVLTPQAVTVLFPKVSTLQEKLMKIHMYDDDSLEPIEEVPSDLANHTESYRLAIDKLIDLQNQFKKKSLEIRDIKKLAQEIESKTPYTEKLVKIIDDFCQDANLDQLQEDYKEARREVSKYRSLFSLCKTYDVLNRYMCFVCVENPVDHCLVPCGHVICSKCADKITGSCPFCRANFQKKLKLYLD
jgi:Zinc finger, C3HC4 type (RING finger)